MPLEQMILPAIGTLALGTALIVPLRDNRLGKRSTVYISARPLRPNFAALIESGDTANGAPKECDPSYADDFVCDAGECDSISPPLSATDFRATLENLGTRVRRFFSAAAKPEEQDEAPDVAQSDPDPDPDQAIFVRSFADSLDELLPVAREPDIEPTAPVELVSTSRGDAAAHRVPASASGHIGLDRIVPLTRMPLRPQAREITWPQLVSPPRSLATESQRLAFLASSVHSSDPSLEAALRTAYGEEEPPGRVLALRALATCAPSMATDIFIDALHVGGDDERSLAIDALLATGHRDSIPFAFDDRVDALAAQAALGYVGSHAREDYLAALAPYCDRIRIETLLSLLAGTVE